MINRSILTLIIGVAGVVFTANGNAGPLALQQGYDHCAIEIKSQHEGVVMARNYLLQRNQASNSFFINSTAWEAGDRRRLRTFCETSKSGRQILALETSHGRWVTPAEGRVTIEVAKK